MIHISITLHHWPATAQLQGDIHQFHSISNITAKAHLDTQCSFAQTCSAAQLLASVCPNLLQQGSFRTPQTLPLNCLAKQAIQCHQSTHQNGQQNECCDIIHCAHRKSFKIITHLHVGAAPGGGWTPSGCCNQPGCGRPPAACLRKSSAAGLGGCPPCPESWTLRSQWCLKTPPPA
jgi:hypothetical protein